MKKYGWGNLPESVRAGVRARVGDIVECTEINAGQSSNIAAVLRRVEGEPIFLKGVEGISPPMRWLRNEAEIGRLASGIAPAVHFSADIDDWLVVGFEYLPGRPAQLEPGSDDLDLVAKTLNRIGDVQAPDLRSLELRWQSSWWERLAAERPRVLGDWNLDELMSWEQKAAAYVAGDHLLHTDLHADQFIVSEEGDVHVIDWGWPARGAAWVDPAFMVLRLIDAGLRAADAEAWARHTTRWGEASEEAITAFAVYVAGLWSYKAATTPELAQLARLYVDWRLP